MATSALNDVVEPNPLLEQFVFPPFDAVESKHVRPGIRALLQKLVKSFHLYRFLINGF
jgi:oligopeptidase A